MKCCHESTAKGTRGKRIDTVRQHKKIHFRTWDRHILCESALERRSRKLGTLTEVLKARLTPIAKPTRVVERRNDSIAHMKIPDLAAHLHNNPSHLVPEYQRQPWVHPQPIPVSFPDVPVCPAYAASIKLDDHAIGGNSWKINFGHRERLVLPDHQSRSHCLLQRGTTHS